MLTRWWVRLAVVAVAYMVIGRLALLLAIPPGFATAIWPASGFAVVAVARWGWSAAIGVALGSFGVNLATGGAAIGAALALGPALQAVFAALLVRRAIGELTLERGRDIAVFYLLAGPFACLVAATWGMVVLHGAGVIAMSELAYSWLTWWVGDTVGVMLAAPITLVFIGAPRTLWRTRWLTVGVPLSLVTVGAMVAYLNANAYERSRDTIVLETRASAIASAIHQRVERYSVSVQSLASLISANRAVSKEQFATFASGTFGRDPDIQGLAWAPRVPHDERAAFVAAARMQLAEWGLGDYDLVERAPNPDGARGGTPHTTKPTFVPAAERPEYFPSLYAEPAGRQHGFDLASDPSRLYALQVARDTGEPAMTPPLVLLHGEPGFIIVAPVYTRDAEPTLLGVTVGGFSTRATIASATDDLDIRDLRIAVTDVTGGPLTPAVASAVERDIVVAGRTWRVGIAPVGASERGWQPWFALARLVVIGMLGAVLLAITGGRSRIAVAEARNLEVERKTVEDIEVAERDHAFQLELGDILHSSESVRGVLARSALWIADYLKLDKCHFAEIDVDDAQVVLHQYTPGKKKESDEILPLSSFEAVGLGELVKGTRYIVNDTTTDERTSARHDAAYAPRSIRAFITVPLMRGGLCVSYFGAISATPREWTQREITLVQSVAERTWLWAEHLRSLHGLRANEQQLRELARYLEERVEERTQDLVRAVGERESLLKEIHHRVKNNLQVISSMLNLQARRITDPRFKGVFDESQQRIQTIALVHERLYQSPDLSSIGFDDYLKSLVANVMAAQSAARVTAITEVENVTLPIKTAIPCGLIVNELVTNALKYAFPGERTGTITVSMQADGDHVVLRVADDGVGLPTTLDPAKAKTLGLDLVYTFADQLDATVDVASSPAGAAFTLRFPAGS